MEGEAKMYREPMRSLQDSGNYIVKEGNNWKAKLSDGADIVLPEPLGKAAYVALDLLTKQIMRHDGGWTSRGLSNIFTEASLKRFDCHALVAYGIGALKDLKMMKTLSYTAHHLFFPPEQFTQCSTLDEFKKIAIPLLEKEPIAVFQMSSVERPLSHSFFALKGNANIYVFYRGGRTGGVLFERLDDAAWKSLIDSYGTKFAGDAYSALAGREDLKEYYSKGHYSD